MIFASLAYRMPPHEVAYNQIGLIFWDLRRNVISNERLSCWMPRLRNSGLSFLLRTIGRMELCSINS